MKSSINEELKYIDRETCKHNGIIQAMKCSEDNINELITENNQ